MTRFEWDAHKELTNIRKHGVDFSTAIKAFFDPDRCITTDEKHSHLEPRYFCTGKVESEILTVRFTYREDAIRIIGAGHWRKGRSFYEKKKRSR